MGVEVGKSDGFEVAPAPFESVAEHGKANGKLDQDKGHKVSIKFGSHDEPIKREDNNNEFSSDVPKDVTEEWPVAKQIHSFYFVRYRPYDDPKIKAKLEQTEKELQKLNRARAGIIEELKAKRANRSELFNQLDPLKSERKGYNAIFDEKKKEMEPLQQALGKLRSNDGGPRSIGLCTSEEELNDLIYSLQYRIQHESISLNEEKQLLKEIKQLEGTREKVNANAAMRAKIKESLGQKEEIQDQVKLMGVDLDGVRKERQTLTGKINQLSEKLKASKDELQSLDNELKVVTEKRDKIFSNLQELRKQRDETNANFYQSRTVLNKARELAANKNIKDLEALSHAEVEKFISLWSSKKNFRDDYEKRILPSLDARQLSRDGRIRNPNEKPLIALEAPQKAQLPSETEAMPKAKAKQSKEDPNSTSRQDTSLTQKTQKDASNKAKDTHKVKDTKPSSDHKDTEDEDVPVLGKLQKADKEVDEAELKEMKRLEEMEKAKQAMERKRKLAEKAAAKAALRAQKEAEKKLKEREKKAKKKGAANSSSEPEAASEEVTEASEPEKNEVEAPGPEREKLEKEKVLKEKPIRNRNRAKGPEALPRAILKRRKSTNYWLWAGPAAVILLVLLILVYYYVL